MSDSQDSFVHPQRFPKNAPGSFYSLGDVGGDGGWSGLCLSCTIPESEAPTLLASLGDENSDTYFIRQPVTTEEIEQACRAVEVCCVDAIRYGGRDPQIIRRLGPELCDFAKELGVTVKAQSRSAHAKRWWQVWR